MPGHEAPDLGWYPKSKNCEYLQKHLFTYVLQNRCSEGGLKVCNFIKRRLQHRCFSVKFPEFLKHLFKQNTSDGCFCAYLLTYFVLVEIISKNKDFYLMHMKELFKVQQKFYFYICQTF